MKKKPYIEKPDSTDNMVHNPEALKAFADQNWDIYKARNDSVITDLFAGMYKSTVTCPVCDKVSIIFDPFNTLTLQLPIENNWSKEVYFFPLHNRPIRVDVDIDKNASMRTLKEFVAKRVGCDPEKDDHGPSHTNQSSTGCLTMSQRYQRPIYRVQISFVSTKWNRCQRTMIQRSTRKLLFTAVKKRRRYRTSTLQRQTVCSFRSLIASSNPATPVSELSLVNPVML